MTHCFVPVEIRSKPYDDILTVRVGQLQDHFRSNIRNIKSRRFWFLSSANRKNVYHYQQQLEMLQSVEHWQLRGMPFGIIYISAELYRLIFCTFLASDIVAGSINVEKIIARG